MTTAAHYVIFVKDVRDSLLICSTHDPAQSKQPSDIRVIPITDWYNFHVQRMRTQPTDEEVFKRLVRFFRLFRIFFELILVFGIQWAEMDKLNEEGGAKVKTEGEAHVRSRGRRGGGGGDDDDGMYSGQADWDYEDGDTGFVEETEDSETAATLSNLQVRRPPKG